MNAVSPREFKVQDLPEINTQLFKCGDNYNRVVLGTARHGMSFNAFERFANVPNDAMTLAMKLAHVDLSPEQMEKAKTVALDVAAKGRKISLRALIELWEPIPELHGFAQNLRLCVPLS